MLRMKPYYRVSESEGSWRADPAVAQESVNRMSEFDADENVFVCLAHNPGLLPICGWFSNGTL